MEDLFLHADRLNQKGIQYPHEDLAAELAEKSSLAPPPTSTYSTLMYNSKGRMTSTVPFLREIHPDLWLPFCYSVFEPEILYPLVPIQINPAAICICTYLLFLAYLPSQERPKRSLLHFLIFFSFSLSLSLPWSFSFGGNEINKGRNQLGSSNPLSPTQDVPCFN